MTRVIDGGRTRSRSANAPGVIAPSLASVDSADNCDKDTGDSGRRNRNWRANRITASDKSLANRESTSFTKQRIASNSSRRAAKHGGLPSRRTPEARLYTDERRTARSPPSRNRLPCLAILLEPWPVILVIAAAG